MIGLYVHIPFCLSKCNYCDFSSFAGLESDKRVQYITALSEEIRSYKREKKLPLETVFFGGGTPSLLTPREFYSVFSAINDSFDLSYVNELSYNKLCCRNININVI
jgi:oxygen-independent coproporphyrinogen-3 oxidase